MGVLKFELNLSRNRWCVYTSYSLWLEHGASILHKWRMRAVQDARNALKALEVPHEVSLTPAYLIISSLLGM